MDFDDEQLFNISTLFKTLNIDDYNKKLAPYNNNFSYNDYAPYDLELEEECKMGCNCIFKNTPLICHKNHQGLKNIKKHQFISPLLCKYERPWKIIKETRKPMRCNNINCWFSHLKGRKEHLKNIILELNKSIID